MRGKGTSHQYGVAWVHGRHNVSCAHSCHTHTASQSPAEHTTLGVGNTPPKSRGNYRDCIEPTTKPTPNTPTHTQTNNPKQNNHHTKHTQQNQTNHTTPNHQNTHNPNTPPNQTNHHPPTTPTPQTHTTKQPPNQQTPHTQQPQTHHPKSRGNYGDCLDCLALS
ncbi:hypothetical protein J6590_099515 [Homalodisca vitripennis]|nr:hypothetical protein J6590_099515 [Homalodisca vitripennis]